MLHHPVKADLPARTNLFAVPMMLALVMLWDGLGYAFGPSSWASSPTLYYFGFYPGGIRGYGVLELVNALLLGGALLLRHRRAVRVGEALVVSLSLLNVVTVLLSWSTEGIVAWGSPSKGAAIAATAYFIMRRTPGAPDDGPD